MRWVFLPALLGASLSALAQPAAPTERIVVAPQVCAALADLRPDQGAAYVPGVDAGGRSVAPADLPGAPPLAISDFPIEITVNLRRRFGIPADARLFQGIGRLGFVTVQGNDAYFNGQKLTGGEQAMLAEACRAARR